MSGIDDFRRDCEMHREKIWKELNEMAKSLAVLKSKFAWTVIVTNAATTAVVVYIVTRLLQG